MKVEYTDVKRFLVSLGVIFVASSFIVPWLVLREPFAMNVTSVDLNGLTVIGRLMVYYRQVLGLGLGIIIPCMISPVLLLFGLGFIIFGLSKWWEMQDILDRREKAITGQEEEKLKQMSPREIDNKDIVEAQQEVEFGLEEFKPQRNMIDKYTTIEGRVEFFLRKCFPPGVCTFLPNRRIGSAFYDLVIQFVGINSPDLIIETKYTQKGYRSGWVFETATRVLFSKERYEVTLKRKAIAFILFISPEIPSRAESISGNYSIR